MQRHLAHLRAALCRNGVDQMRADAEGALAGLPAGDTTRGSILLLLGIAYLLDGNSDRADPVLAHAAEVATDDRALPATSFALAERAVIAIQRQDWSEAETVAERALGVVRAGHLDDYVMSPLVYAVVARAAAHRGDAARAESNSRGPLAFGRC